MKLLFASDLHGSLWGARRLRDVWLQEAPQKLVLLGDLLYHGPRNDLPPEYDPKGVLSLLNGMKTEILCVRGNCDAEVDQMVLDFPVLADYAIFYLEGRMAFVTHGHHFHEDALPPLKDGDLLLNGHTHLPCIRAHTSPVSYTYLNPGSVSLPKGSNPPTYLLYQDGLFTLKAFDGTVLDTLAL